MNTKRPQDQDTEEWLADYKKEEKRIMDMQRPAVARLTPYQRVQRILDEAVGRDLSSWEKHDFLPSVSQRGHLTEKQEKTLREIEDKVGIRRDDE